MKLHVVTLFITEKRLLYIFVLKNCVNFDIQLLLNTLYEGTIRIVVPIQAYYKMPPEKVTIFYLCCNIHYGKKLYGYIYQKLEQRVNYNR